MMSDELVERLTDASQLRFQYGSMLDVMLSEAPAVLLHVDRLNKALVGGNWTAVRVEIAKCRSLARDLRLRLVDSAQREAEIVAAVRGLAGPLQSTFNDLPGSHAPDLLVAEAVELVQRSGADAPEQLEDLLRQVLIDGTDQIQAVLGTYDLRRYQALRRRLASVVILGRVRALWTRQLADFNVHLQTLPVARKNQPLFNEAIFTGLKASIDDFRQKLHDRQRALFESASTLERLERAHALVEQMDAALPGLSEAQAMLYLSGFALRKLGKGGVSEQVGSRAASAAALVREAIASVAAAERIALGIELGYPDQEVDSLIATAGSRPFDGSFPRGKVLPLNHLSEAADGTHVELAAYVQGIESGRSGDKLVSRAHLKDPSSGARATVAAIFVHFRHLGLTGGCFLRASGVLRHSSQLAGGDVAVEVDRLSLKEIAASSWRIGLLALSHPWFEVWRNAQNITCSWGAHRPGSNGDGVVPGLEGAAEPVFTPFLRGIANA
jgi:hypothetical protein